MLLEPSAVSDAEPHALRSGRLHLKDQVAEGAPIGGQRQFEFLYGKFLFGARRVEHHAARFGPRLSAGQQDKQGD